MLTFRKRVSFAVVALLAASGVVFVSAVLVAAMFHGLGG